MNNNQSGFTLIELAISMIVIGLVLSMTISSIKVTTVNQRYKKSQKITESLNKHIEHFYAMNGFLPCPISASDFKPDSFNCNSSLTPNVQKEVLNGIVPFPALGIKENQILDAWKQPIRYSVSRNLTTSYINEDRNGYIKLKDENGNIFNDALKAKYTLFSLGANNPDIEGSFKCESLHAHETENCDNNNDALTAGQYSNTPDNFFDDIIFHYNFIKEENEETGCYIDGSDDPADTTKETIYIFHNQNFKLCATTTNCTDYICKYGQLIKQSSIFYE